MLTQNKLKQALDYNPETGVFIWKVARGTRTDLIGSVAGTKHHKGYREIEIDSKAYMAHRLAALFMTGKFPDYQMDHINGVRDDNRWANLRNCTRQENHQNRKLDKRNKSDHTGVHWCKTNKRFIAQIKVNQKQTVLGRFKTLQEAVDCYNFHKVKIHEFNPVLRDK